LAGFEDALRSYGIQVKRGHLQFGNFLQESGYQCARKLFSARHPPTALFVANMEMAAGVIAFVRDNGISIPEEISIVSFDDSF
jgi:DNA-binding LacI/PurR family transcriptional regulator